MTTDSGEFVRKTDKLFKFIMLRINMLAFIFGVFYLLNQKSSVFWNIYGFVMLAAFLGNLALAFVEEKIKWLGYAYLGISSVSMLLLPLVNTVVSTMPSNHKSQSFVSIVLIFVLFLLGGGIAGREYIYPSAHGEDQRSIGKGAKYTILVLLGMVLFSGVFIITNLLQRDKTGILEVFVPDYSLFYAIVYLSIGATIIKLMGESTRQAFKLLISVLTGLIFVVCMLPIASVPVLLKNAEHSYDATFGNSYRDAAEFRSGLFRQVRFSLPEYFYGIPSKDYSVQENILYYQGTEGVDKGLLLHFDAYTPPKDKGQLPGGNSVLIRIHGGGWSIGDKGIGNFAQVNKYFASQGYVVFDVQYGLNEKHKMVKSYPIEATRTGDFSIDDMVRHLGIFTKYLADHKDEYGANLGSVFVSGGSAGGQLTSALALGISSGEYSNILDSRLNIRGFIPFYPANGLPKNVELGGQKELSDPTHLVSAQSPPSLIYQGDHDGMVDPAIAEGFRAAYHEKGNNGCAVLKMPFAAMQAIFISPVTITKYLCTTWKDLCTSINRAQA